MSIRLLSIATLATGLSLGGVHAAPIELQPLIGGLYTNGDGVNSQVDADWRGVIYGPETWGTGIWGLADANIVLGLDGAHPGVVNVYNGVLGQIHWADKRYIDTWSATWGTQDLVPFFIDDASQYQDNYAVRFSGFIAITDPGLYNFGVLYDDGFVFNLYGQGSSLNLIKDGLNPRDRLGFDQDLNLGVGLYAFDLIAWERLEAGVVDLSWIRPGGDWTTIPQSHLFTSAVPEPASVALMFAGLGLLGWHRAKTAK